MDMFIVVFLMLFVFIFTLMIYASRYTRVPPDKAMVIFGRKHSADMRVVKGGGVFVLPILEEATFISLSVQTLDISVESVVTKQGVMLDVEAVAQVKISSDDQLLRTAAEQLLHKQRDEINYIARRSLEGHVRGVCARLSVEDINADRNMVAMAIQDSAGVDLASMGLEVVSFTIRDLRDQVGYLQALGKGRTAEIMRDAMIGEAKALEEGRAAEAKAAAAIAEAIRDKNMKILAYEKQLKKKENEAKRNALKQQVLAFWEARRFFERYETAGKSLFILEKALQEMDRVLVGEEKKGVLRLLEESGMPEDELLVIDEILRSPGSEGEALFQEKIQKFRTWLQDMETEKKAHEEQVLNGSDPFTETRQTGPE